jgi:ferric-dicitrate binding protein FerR (iron transport regulator)
LIRQGRAQALEAADERFEHHKELESKCAAQRDESCRHTRPWSHIENCWSLIAQDAVMERPASPMLSLLATPFQFPGARPVAVLLTYPLLILGAPLLLLTRGHFGTAVVTTLLGVQFRPGFAYLANSFLLSLGGTLPAGGL